MRRVALAFLLLGAPATAASVAGPAKVVDGDTLEIAGKRIRLFGIDAPEATQTCARDRMRWSCGRAATERLRALIGDSGVSCSGTESDQYGRLLAVCTIGGADLNQAMVADGWATAFRRYSDAYVADEARARAAKLGLWASSFEVPEDYRAQQRERAAASARPARTVVAPLTRARGCLIKGNRNRKGQWIYHLPGTPNYEATRAEEVFCSEAEAQAAGYRAPRGR
jgi:endonuclease YncB( thermonuclease family)